MNKVLQVALNDLRITFQNRGIWINLVIIPAVLIFAIGFVSGGFPSDSDEAPQLRIDVFDNDESELSAQFLETLRAVNTNLVLCPMDDSENTNCGLGDAELTVEMSIERVNNGETQSIIEIPAGFDEALLSGEPISVVYRSDTDITQPDPLQQSVQAAVQRVSGASVAARVGVDVYEDSFNFNTDTAREEFSQTVYDTAANYWITPPATVEYTLSTGEAGDGAGGFGQSVPGMGSMYVMFTVLAGAVTLIQERQNWTLQRLFTMPISRGQILGGKMLARFVMGMIQYGVAFGIGLMLGINFGDSPLGLLLIMVAFSICITALTFMLATFVETEQQANSIILFVALTFAPLGGAWWPLEVVPDFMQTIGHLSPVAWAMDGFTEIIYNGGGVADVLVSIAVLLAAAVVMFGIGIVNFKYE